VIKVLPPERVVLSTDCGMKPLPGIVAKMKLEALAEGARIVRKEFGVGQASQTQSTQKRTTTC
jgi:5-methyltetrahydropteroyltriglutamate--homocysteine methyltransferase